MENRNKGLLYLYEQIGVIFAFFVSLLFSIVLIFLSLFKAILIGKLTPIKVAWEKRLSLIELESSEDKALFTSIGIGLIITAGLLYNAIKIGGDGYIISGIFWSPVYIFIFSYILFKLWKWLDSFANKS